MDRFDVFDTDFIASKGSYYKYKRVCRICGGELLDKNGKYSYRKRYCNKKCSASEIWFSWQDKRWKYIESKIKEENSLDKDPYYCELCNKHLNYYKIEVHHKIPVHTLTFEQLYLIWDFDNLIMLCHECHTKQDHKLKHGPIKPSIYNEKKWKKITDFFK